MIELFPSGLPSKDFAKCPQCSYRIPLGKIHNRFHCPGCHISLSSNKQKSRLISLLVASICFLLLGSAILLVDQAYYHPLTSSSYYLVTGLFCSVLAFYIANLLFLLMFRIKTAL